MATNYGIIVAAIIGKEGWYRAACFSFASYVEGVSIKGTALTVGQRVAIVQSGSWDDDRRGFAFAETDVGIYSHIELRETKNWVIDTNQVGASLAYLLHKAGKAQELYHPAKVTAVNADSLTVKDWYTDEPLGVWPLASDLNINDFSIGDGVLLRMIPDAVMRVEGWWETYNASTYWRAKATGINLPTPSSYKLIYTLSEAVIIDHSDWVGYYNQPLPFSTNPVLNDLSGHAPLGTETKYYGDIPHPFGPYQGGQITSEFAIPKPITGWTDLMWPVTVGFYSLSDNSAYFEISIAKNSGSFVVFK